MIKQDILEYLNTLRKSPIDDPTQKWIGSYNGRQMILNKFLDGYTTLMNPITKRGRLPLVCKE